MRGRSKTIRSDDINEHEQGEASPPRGADVRTDGPNMQPNGTIPIIVWADGVLATRP